MAAACAGAPAAPHMRPPPAALAAMEQGRAMVVFVRPASSCDTFDHAVIVHGAEGRFVGTSAPRTHFAVSVPPGRHVFMAWPGMDLTTAPRDDLAYFTGQSVATPGHPWTAA